MQGLKPGAMLRHNTYRIEKMLGQGGFGITYLATDLNLDRLVAIKEFFPKDYCDRDSSTSHVTIGTQSAKELVEKLKAKFLKEARNIAKFDHPGIIRIHAAFEENQTAYYIMDYIEGESLSEMVRRIGPLPESQAIAYIEKLGNALEYIHERKVNHLDIKPANIMVRKSDDNPILIDFGLSKQYDSSGNQTSTTPTGISHGYAPMEQYKDGGVREFSPQTDLYSLAATFYYMLSGVVPPQSVKLVEDELTFPASISTSLIDPISKAMSPARRNRHETVGKFISEVVRDSHSDVDTEVTIHPAATPQPQPEPSPVVDPDYYEEEPKSRKKLYIGIAAAAIVIAVIAFSFMGGGSGNEGDKLAADSALVAAPRVTDLYWESPLGIASYSGEVMVDSVSGTKAPHGKGIARITAGKYVGSIYEGEFNQGNMDGEATYTLKNGDVFKGTYKDNKYHHGRYTIKGSGDYFEGTFKNGNPDKGDWYNSKGQKLN